MISLPTSDARYRALYDESAQPQMLVTIAFPAGAGGTRRLTDAPRDLTVSGATYLAHLGLVGVSPLEPRGVLDRNLLELQFADPDLGTSSWSHRFTVEGHTGIRLSLSVVFVSGGSLSAPLSVYSGGCAGVRLTWQDGRVVLARFAGPFARRAGNPVVATDTAQRGRRSTDTSLHYIATSRNIQWGRKVPKGWENVFPENA